MAKPTNPKSGSLIDRFNKRREKVAAEARSDQTDKEHLVSKDLEDTDVADAKDEIVVGEVFHTNEGLDKLDWSKAGNFRVTSSTNDITWVMYTGG